MPIRLEAGILAEPEGRVDRERIDVREKITRLVHELDCLLAIRDADVHVQSENEIRPRNLLQIVDDRGIALARRDQLIHPM